MNTEWHNPKLAHEYAEKLDEVDWYEYEVNMPSLLSLIPGDTMSILDFGSGPGQFTAQLAATYQTEGADASPAMIAIARANCPDVPFHLWDGQSAYPAGRTFDVIFSKLTVHFIEDLALFARHARGALHARGSVVYSVPHPVRTTPKVRGEYSPQATYDSAIGKYGLHVHMIHRSFSDYVQPFLEHGFVLTGVDEPRVTPRTTRKISRSRGGSLPSKTSQPALYAYLIISVL